MALSEKSRHAMYEYFVAELGEETASEMLSHFPARDVEEPVTKEYLQGEFALVRMEFHEQISGLRAEMRDEITGLRAEMRDEITGLRAEMRDEITGLRAEMREEISGLRTEMREELHDEISGLRAEMRDEISGLRTEFGDRLSSELRHQLQWIIGIQIAMLGIVVALVVAFA